MRASLIVGRYEYSAEAVLDFIRKHGLLQPILKEMILEQEITGIEVTDSEASGAIQRFMLQFADESEVGEYAKSRGITPEELYGLIMRQRRLDKYKVSRWGNQVNSFFLEKKSGLDQVLYSLIRVPDPGVAQELYFRIQDDGVPMSLVANEYASQAEEGPVDGLIGPVRLSELHPELARLLSISQPGQLLGPMSVGKWSVILRLEKRLPAKLDESMRAFLIEELHAQWLERVSTSSLASLSEYLVGQPGDDMALLS